MILIARIAVQEWWWSMSREEAIDIIRNSVIQIGRCNGKSRFMDAIITLLDPERKTGKWINHRNDRGHNIADCDQCGETMQWYDPDSKPNFCPKCGARMETESRYYENKGDDD